MGKTLSGSCRDLIALSLVPGIGPASVKALLDEAGSLEKVFSLSQDRVREITRGRGAGIAGFRAVRESKEFIEELEYIAGEGIKAVSFLDEGYPALLKEIHDPPPVLFLKGEILPEDSSAVAIVGSRRCSIYGTRVAEKLAFDLALRGITVVSGMARGIDSAAHKGAMKAGGRTIAVMGSGFGNIYPRESEGLAVEIAGSGAVVTEFPSGVVPVKHNFPRRNRIISGLVKGVVVVEAAEKSGALITVDFALDEGRDVFAVPGRIDSPASSGTNRLIKNGAKLVTSVEDITEELGLVLRDGGSCGQKGNVSAARKTLSEDERAVLRVLGEEDGAHIDVLADRSGLGRRISEVLLKMEIKGLVSASAGRKYSSIDGNM